MPDIYRGQACPHVATLVCNPESPILKAPLLQSVRDALPTSRVVWLNQGVAVDFLFESALGDLAALRRTLLAAVAGEEADIIVQPVVHRRKRLFLADMDSTMIGQECIDELAAFAGLKEKVSAITERAMRGELAFEPALRERVAMLKGLPVDIVDEIIETRLTLTPGGRTLVETMKASGGYCCLVSGGFTLFTSRIGARIGFDENRANELLTAGETFAGTVAEPILGREAKLATLIELRGKFGFSAVETMAVGDGANDLAMLEEADMGYAYRAKPHVASAADAQINHADLTALLYAQGYVRGDFVDG